MPDVAKPEDEKKDEPKRGEKKDEGFPPELRQPMIGGPNLNPYAEFVVSNPRDGSHASRNAQAILRGGHGGGRLPQAGRVSRSRGTESAG